MSNMQPHHLAYARKRAASAARKAVPMKVSAIWAIRDLVEEQQATTEEALSAVFATFQLGLGEIEQISTEAHKRYTKVAA